MEMILSCFTFFIAFPLGKVAFAVCLASQMTDEVSFQKLLCTKAPHQSLAGS